jgi:hypothetical protein
MGAVEALGAVCPPVGFALGGAVVFLTSPRTAFLVAGLGTVADAAALFGISGVRRAMPDERDSESMVHIPAGALGDPISREPAAK